MTRLGVKVTNEDDRVCPSCLLNELEDLKKLAVTATGIGLQKKQTSCGYHSERHFRKACELKNWKKGQGDEADIHVHDM